MNNKVKIEVVVNNSKYFIKDLIDNKINIYDLDINNDNIKLIVSLDDYKIIRKKKTIKKISIIDYYGPYKIINFFNCYKVNILVLILGIVINIILSNLILKVEIITPNNKLKEIVRKDLLELGISKGKWKKNFKEKELIKEKILNKEKDKIEWLEISNTGTKYIVKIEERKIKEEKKMCLPRNIIAKKDAIVTKIESSVGEVKTKINDYVNKDSVLISGFIYNNEDVVSKKCAIGNVYGEVWYKVVVSFPKKDKRIVNTNNCSLGLAIHFLDKEYNLFIKDKIYKKKEYNILGSDVIPFGLYLIKTNKLEEKSYYYSINNIDIIALEVASLNLSKSFDNKPVILRKKVLKKYTNNSRIIVEVFIALEEDITSYQDITFVSIEEMNKKEE